MAVRKSTVRKSLMRKALVVPLSVVLAAGCSPSVAFAGMQAADVSGLQADEPTTETIMQTSAEPDKSTLQPTAIERVLLSSASNSVSPQELYFPVLLRAVGGTDEYEESYQACGDNLWSPTYALFDLGSDGVPELLVRANEAGGSASVHVYTVQANEVKYLGTYSEGSGSTAGNSRGQLFVSGWNQGQSFVNEVTVVDGKVKSKFIASGQASNTYFAQVDAFWIEFNDAYKYVKLQEEGKYELSKATMRVASAGEYTGSAKTPAVTIQFGNETLVAGADYVVTYKNNVNAGTATVVVEGIGSFQGTQSANFAIERANIARATMGVAAGGDYTGAAKKPAVSAQLGSRQLKVNSDYQVSYKNNVNAGTATATITGIGNYQGSKAGSFTIGRADVSKATVSVASGGSYTGSAKTPAVTARLGSATLKQGIDFKVVYKNNKSAGSAKATITGTGNYKGSKATSFTISKAANTMTIKTTGKTFSLASVKKAAQKYNAVSFSKKAQGKVTYKNVSASSVSKHITVNSSNGSVTVKKGTSKGSYNVKVQVSAAGDSNHKSVCKTVTAKVVVK